MRLRVKLNPKFDFTLSRIKHSAYLTPFTLESAFLIFYKLLKFNKIISS